MLSPNITRLALSKTKDILAIAFSYQALWRSLFLQRYDEFWQKITAFTQKS